MTRDLGPRLVIEPLDPARHDRTSFSCGVEQVDNYFKRTANKLAKSDNARIWVLVSDDRGLVGFYAINAHAVHFEELPDRFAKARPRNGHVPAAYISMIGVDRRFAGQGHGGDLLVDALRRIARAADDLGIAVVLMDVLDCGDPASVARRRRLYLSYGFAPLPSNPSRLFLTMGTIRSVVAG